MPSYKKTFTLRLEDENFEKIRFISSKNKRSIANQIEYLVEQYISEYEKENGLIDIIKDKNKGE